MRVSLQGQMEPPISCTDCCMKLELVEPAALHLVVQKKKKIKSEDVNKHISMRSAKERGFSQRDCPSSFSS